MAAAPSLQHSAGMEIARIDPEDEAGAAAYAEVRNAASDVDAPWLHHFSARSVLADMTHGWDGEPDVLFLGVEDGTPVGAGLVFTSGYDNLHLAWLGVKIHPAHRRRGLGTQLLERMVEEARALGRTSFGTDAWEDDGFAAFAARHGFEVKSRAINRRQVVADLDWDELAQRYDAALPSAADYELVRRLGPTPEDELDAVADMSVAINDAPTDDLDIEDEVYSAERIRGYETAQEVRGGRLYRVFARHRTTGDLAGHTVVVVDGHHPQHADQHDTSVVGAHRGHRLGLLLKAEMNLWLHEAEPQLETVDTWNAESNDHMIGVNELLGYRILGREHQYQKSD